MSIYWGEKAITAVPDNRGLFSRAEAKYYYYRSLEGEDINGLASICVEQSSLTLYTQWTMPVLQAVGPV